MGIFDRFKAKPNSADNDTRPLPFVHLIGHEKVYGRDKKVNPDLLIAQYKSWSYACIQRIAFAIADTKLAVYKKTYTQMDGEKLTLVPQHPFMDLMGSVNGFFNRFELWMLTDIFLELTGNAYWWIPKGVLGIPAVIWNIPSPWMNPIPSKTKFVEGYALKVPSQGTPIFIPEEEIVHFKFPSPFDMWQGTSPTLAGAFGIDLNNNMKEWSINFFMNNAQPSGILTTDDNINQASASRLRDMWNAMHRGVKNSGKTAIMGGGLKYQKMGSTLGEMKMEDFNRGIRDEILAMYGVPASILGLVEDVNRANAEANEYSFQKHSILPRIRLIEEKLNEKIMPMYDASLIVQFDNPVPDDKEFRLREREANIRSGYSSIDDERIKDGEEPYELLETSRPLIAFSVTPAQTEEEQQEAQDQMEEQMNSDRYTEEEQDDDKDDKKPTDKKTKAMIAKHNSKWRRFMAIQEPIERMMASEMRTYFKRQFRDIKENLNRFKSVKGQKNIDQTAIGSILFNVNEANEDLKQVSAKYIENAYYAGISLGKIDLGLFDDFKPVKVNVARVVKARIDYFAEKVNDSTYKLVSQSISEGIINGESYDQVVARIDKVADYTINHRSDYTARTETVGALNEGNLDFYKEAGIETKQWVTAGDENTVRWSHWNMKKSVADIGDPFITGDGSYLQYPCDRSSDAPAKDIINCRCSVIHGEV